MHRLAGSVVALALSLGCCPLAAAQAAPRGFDPARDLVSLHYDHAPDKDDGQSAAADRTVLQTVHGVEWIKKHVVAVSGAYGKNGPEFNAGSDRVMDVVWKDLGGWLPGHTNREQVVQDLTRRWTDVLKAGGDVWVKEGGQSDITADVVRALKKGWPDLDTKARIHVVQHSRWNEEQTGVAALDYARQHTHYIRIRDANTYLNVKGGDKPFVEAARRHPKFGPSWRAAFAYYAPEERLDFSDTGELLHILGLGELGIDAFRQRFLS